MHTKLKQTRNKRMFYCIFPCFQGLVQLNLFITKSCQMLYWWTFDKNDTKLFYCCSIPDQ